MATGIAMPSKKTKNKRDVPYFGKKNMERQKGVVAFFDGDVGGGIGVSKNKKKLNFLSSFF